MNLLGKFQFNRKLWSRKINNNGLNFRKYSVIVFIACLRFETAKRRLQYLDFSDFFECAQSIMTYWTYTYQHSGPEYYDTEMDREFLLDLREVRSLLDKEKEIKQ